MEGFPSSSWGLALQGRDSPSRNYLLLSDSGSQTQESIESPGGLVWIQITSTPSEFLIQSVWVSTQMGKFPDDAATAIPGPHFDSHQPKKNRPLTALTSNHSGTILSSMFCLESWKDWGLYSPVLTRKHPSDPLILQSSYSLFSQWRGKIQFAWIIKASNILGMFPHNSSNSRQIYINNLCDHHPLTCFTSVKKICGKLWNGQENIIVCPV